MSTIGVKAIKYPDGDSAINITDGGNVTLAGTLDVTDVLSVGEYIRHIGDTDTQLRFTTDTLQLYVGNNENLTVGTGQVIINQGSADCDFRVESNDQANMLFVDGGNNIVSIVGGGSHAVGNFANTLQIEGTTGSTSSMSITRNTAGTSPPYLQFGKTRGTSVGSSTVVQNGDDLGIITFSGGDGTDRNTNAAMIRASVDGTPGSNDMPGRLTFSTTADGASSVTERMRITSAGNVGIGTTSPSAFGGTTFQTNHGSTYSANLVSSGTHVLQVIASQTANAMSIGARSNHHVSFTTNDTEKMRIHSAGRIGIGTSGNTIQGSLVIKDVVDHNGSDVFVVAQNGNASRQAGYKVFDEGGTSSLEMKYDNGSNFARIVNPNNGQLSINLGGTGSANMLDDYEEGTWTPDLRNADNANTFTTEDGYYTKVGNRVFAQFRCDYGNTGGGGGIQIRNLPFTYNGNFSCVGIVAVNGGSMSGSNKQYAVFASSGTTFQIYNGGSISSETYSFLSGSLHYLTNS